MDKYMMHVFYDYTTPLITPLFSFDELTEMLLNNIKNIPNGIRAFTIFKLGSCEYMGLVPKTVMYCDTTSKINITSVNQF